MYRDVRELSDLLLEGDDWGGAAEEFAQRRNRYFEVIREYDRWRTVIGMESGERADRLREGNKAAEEADPTLGGFGLIETHGPDGLSASDEARAIYFGDAAATW